MSAVQEPAGQAGAWQVGADSRYVRAIVAQASSDESY